MKNRVILFLSAAVALISCNKDPNYSESGFVQGGSEFPYVYASVADTKAMIDGKKVSWKKGDIITVYGNALDENYNETATYLMKNDEDAAAGRFTYLKMVCGKKLTAVKSAVFGSYPSDLSSQTMESGVFPASLEGSASSDGVISFGHTVPYSKISINAASDKKLTIYRARVIAEAIGGYTEGGESIDTLNLGFSPNVVLSQDVAAEYYFRTSAIENKEVKCILYDTDGGYMETEPAVLSFAEGAVAELPLVSYEPKKVVIYYPGTELEPVPVREMVNGAERTVLWAPVYCGYSPEHPNGLLYQYGRAAGQPYYPAATSSSVCKTGPVLDPADEFFYKSSGEWYSGTALTFWPEKEGDAGYVEGKIGSPCPSGWRLPTLAEAKGLLDIGFTQSTSGWGFNPQGTDDQKNAVEVKFGYTIKDDSGLFFASVGGRTASGQSYYRGSDDSYARIWCSDIVPGTEAAKASALSLRRKKNSVEPDGLDQTIAALSRGGAIPVRCVKNIN